MDNLTIYKKFKVVPKEAQKEILGGRLKGFTDINPMWRIKMLTEQFGVCGFGWKYEIVSQETKVGANNEISAFVTINLYIKIDDVWSAPIPALGGSAFVANERNGLYTSDECFKMAFTDALSIACKSLGMGADVYFEKDRTKYDNQAEQIPTKDTTAKPSVTTSTVNANQVTAQISTTAPEQGIAPAQTTTVGVKKAGAEQVKVSAKPKEAPKTVAEFDIKQYEEAIKAIKTKAELQKYWGDHKDERNYPEFVDLITKQGKLVK